MVRILAIADETTPSLSVGRIRSIAPDLVVACGDLPFDYIDYVASAANTSYLYVPGNHDPDLNPKPIPTLTPDPWDLAGSDPTGPVGGVNLDGRVATWKGLTFAGLGGSIRYRPGPNQYTELQMRMRVLRVEAKAQWRALTRRGGIDVLVTHSPPRGYGDLDDVAHRGFESFRGLVERLEPEIMIHGHVHPHGFEKPDRSLGNSRLVNVVPFKVIEVNS